MRGSRQSLHHFNQKWLLLHITFTYLSCFFLYRITFYGVCCQKYVNANMDEKSVTTVRYAMKVFAIGSETMIFVFLGITAIDNVIWVWNTGFILLTLLFALIYRFIGECIVLHLRLGSKRNLSLELKSNDTRYHYLLYNTVLFNVRTCVVSVVCWISRRLLLDLDSKPV